MVRTPQGRQILPGTPYLCDTHLPPFVAYRRLQKSIAHYQKNIDFINQKRKEGILISRIGELAPGGPERAAGAAPTFRHYATSKGTRIYTDPICIGTRIWAFRTLSQYANKIERAKELEIKYPGLAQVYDTWVSSATHPSKESV